MTTTADRTGPFIRMTYDVLEAAKDAGDSVVIAACRRAIVNYRHAKRTSTADAATIREAFNEIF